MGSDPVKAGVVASLNRPEGNVTGVSFLINSLGTKRVELISQLVPRVSTIGMLTNPNNPDAEIETRDDLDLVGIAAAAPATELAVLMADDLNSNGGRNLTAMTLWSWQRVFNAPMERVVAKAAIPVVNRLAEECIESIYDLVIRQRVAGSLVKTFLSVPNPLDVEPWRSLAASNTPGVLPSNVPFFSVPGRRRQACATQRNQRLHGQVVRHRQSRAARHVTRG